MSLRRYILGTVTANLALVGALLWQAARPAPPAVRGKLALPAPVAAEVVNEPAARPTDAPSSGSPPFHWSQIESTNHLVCLTNLLAIGCPPETVRDILDARVADDFRARVRELTRPLQVHYWDALAKNEKLESVFDEPAYEKRAKELKAQKTQALGELESALRRAPQTDQPGRIEWNNYQSREKQAELAALEVQQAKERGALKQTAAKFSPADRAAQEKALHARQHTERRALYTDAEWDEYELRHSRQANRVCNLHGLTATASDLRSLAVTMREIELAHPLPVPANRERPWDDPAWKAKSEQVAALEKVALTAQLGEAGFAAFARGSDPRFHTLLKLARRLDLPSANAVQWLELQSAAQDQARLLRANTGVEEQARAAALLAIRAETERTLRNAVGARGWGAYQREAGDWLEQLSE